jgi:hypothetical protein
MNKQNIFFVESFFEKYMPIIKYILAYTWITLYTEENIKNINITIKDRFIFNIETASELPYLAYNISEPKTSPYLPILVADFAINANITPVYSVYSHLYDYKVCNIDIFKNRLSIFFSNSEHNLLEGLDFNGIGITGSCIACCLPNFNPLQLMFNNFNDFTNEYYKNADLDIISNLSDFEFIDKAENISDILRTNISNKLGKTDVEIKSTFIKTVYICVNDEYIKNHFNCSKDEIDFNDIKIREHFYKIYIEKKAKNNIDKEQQLEKYKNIYDNVTIDKINIIYKPKNYITCNENIKYKISTPYTKVIEFFQVKADDFFKSISTFHLPIVRAYYNGSTVYMTSSCRSACMTLYNLDIKYFASTNYPSEIINKYRQRGFGIFLNKKEKLKLMEYSFQNPFWKDQYNIINKTDIKKILSTFDIKNNFYKNIKIIYKYDYTIYDKTVKDSLIFNRDWSNFLYVKYNSTKLKDLDLVNINVINNKGYIEVLNNNYIIIAYTLL